MASFSFCAGRIWSRWAEGKWGGGPGGLGIPPSGCSKGVAIGADGVPFSFSLQGAGGLAGKNGTDGQKVECPRACHGWGGRAVGSISDATGVSRTSSDARVLP